MWKDKKIRNAFNQNSDIYSIGRLCTYFRNLDAGLDIRIIYTCIVFFRFTVYSKYKQISNVSLKSGFLTSRRLAQRIKLLIFSVFGSTPEATWTPFLMIANFVR